VKILHKPQNPPITTHDGRSVRQKRVSKTQHFRSKKRDPMMAQGETQKFRILAEKKKAASGAKSFLSR